MHYSLVFYGRGHKNIVATHRTTLEFTKETWLTTRGNCILLVDCSLAAADIPEEIKATIRNAYTQVKFTLRVGELVDEVVGFGDPNLSLTDSRSMVIRKSAHTSPRTVAIHANKSAIDIDRRLVKRLSQGETAEVELLIV
ncbi:MAG TPA: DUF371 domain-containing protein [bacterium]|nr:DUF371 domain-containing protein [bacterium]